MSLSSFLDLFCEAHEGCQMVERVEVALGLPLIRIMYCFFPKIPLYSETIVHFFKGFLFMSTVFKVFIEFVTIFLLFYVLVFWLRGMWDLSSLTRNQTCAPCIRRQNLNHWTAREVPMCTFLRLRQSW